MQFTSVDSSFERKPEGITRTNLPRESTVPPPVHAAAAPLTLNAEQAAVFEQVKLRSCVVMGPGGCGKSHMIRYMAQWAEQSDISMAVTSLTGAAALVLQVPGATTLHRWSGVGLGKQTVKETLYKMQMKTYLRTRWQNTQILVIDEVSMMSQKLFDLLDGVARAIRGKLNVPFGGMRVVAFGDFYQLAPVPDQFQRTQPPGAPVDPSGCFCFESAAWAALFPPAAHFQLTQMVRQNGDPEFQAVLGEIREGRCSDAAAEYLNKCVVTSAAGSGQSSGSGGPPPIKLYPKNVMVDRENELAYAKVLGAEYIYDQVCATDLDMWMHRGEAFGPRDATLNRKSSSDTRKTELQFMQSGVPCAEKLRLKVGTAVILITNLDVDGGLANGSQGTVVRFDRNTDLEGVLVAQPTPATMLKNKVSAAAAAAPNVLPVVRFANGAERTIDLHWWQSASVPCVGVGQIPLKHGYARSVHASQGATYDSALIDIGGDVFASGQSYVAVSRVRSGKGLKLVRFDRTKIKADPKVTKFYQWLADGGGGGAGATSSSSSSVPAPPIALPQRATDAKKRSSSSSDPKAKWQRSSGTSAPQSSVSSVWGNDDDDDDDK